MIVHNHANHQPLSTAEQSPSGAVEEGGDAANSNGAGQDSLSSEEQRQVQELRARDAEVRAHEQAHAAAAGSLAKGGPSYEYQRGPDGRLYAIGGEVQIDTSPVAGDPEATVQKAEQIQRAALAPADPSSQDRAVAAQAAAMAAQARLEIMKERLEESGAATESLETSNQIETVCAVCGGKHASGSHDATVAYQVAGNTAVDQPRLGGVLEVDS